MLNNLDKYLNGCDRCISFYNDTVNTGINQQMFQSPSKLLKQFLSHPLAGNMTWLLGEKGLRLGITFLMGIWVARYLGPEKFGLLSYAIAFTSLFSPIVRLGLDAIVVRDIVRNLDRPDICIGSAMVLRFIGACFMFIVVLTSQYILDPSDQKMLIMLVIMVTGYFFEPFATLDLWFQSQVLSKYPVIAQTTAAILAAAIKAALILGGGSLIAIVAATSIYFPMAAASLLVVYSRYGRKISCLRFDKDVACRLFGDAWPLMFQGMFVMAYMRIDQIMLKQLTSATELGIYSITVRLTEAFLILPIIFCQSIYPSLIETRRLGKTIFFKHLQRIYTALIWSAISLAVFGSIFSNSVVYFFFGHAYQSAGSVLAIQIWMGCWFYFNIARQSWIVIENIQRLSMWINILACCINIIINYFLIPQYGAHGAAFASILSIIIANLIIAAFSSWIRLSLKMYLKGIAAPITIFYHRFA